MNIDPLAEKMRRHSPYNYAFDNPIYWTDPDGRAPTGGGINPLKIVVNKAAKALKKAGRKGKQKRLREILNDPKASKADKGWIKSEINQIRRGKRKTIRNPPGKDLAHQRGREAAKGFGYEYSYLQDRMLHRLQHRYDNYGRKNKLRPVLLGLLAANTAAAAVGGNQDETATESDPAKDFALKASTWGMGMTDTVENFGTNTFGNNWLGQLINDFNPMNLGLNELMTEQYNIISSDSEDDNTNEQGTTNDNNDSQEQCNEGDDCG